MTTLFSCLTMRPSGLRPRRMSLTETPSACGDWLLLRGCLGGISHPLYCLPCVGEFGVCVLSRVGNGLVVLAGGGPSGWGAMSRRYLEAESLTYCVIVWRWLSPSWSLRWSSLKSTIGKADACGGSRSACLKRGRSAWVRTGIIWDGLQRLTRVQSPDLLVDLEHEKVKRAQPWRAADGVGYYLPDSAFVACYADCIAGQ